jgi:hypothetical protein
MTSTRTRKKLEHSNVRLSTHDPAICAGEPCTIHNRSAHGMRAFPQYWRDDRRIMERICPHGIGHPDPDDFNIRTGHDPGVHGCDGCCRG